MDTNTEEHFSLEKYYMFVYTYTSVHYKIIVCKPEKIFKQFVYFVFPFGNGTLHQIVKKEDILAVDDSDNGDTEIIGWTGKYRLLNRNLFYEYYYKDLIELRT